VWATNKGQHVDECNSIYLDRASWWISNRFCFFQFQCDQKNKKSMKDLIIMIENIQHFNYTKMTFEIHRRHLKWNQFKDILTVMFNSIKICQKFQFFSPKLYQELLWMEKTLKTASHIIIPSAYLLFAFQQERFCKLGWNVKKSIKKSSLILLMIFFTGKTLLA
jgi:hypothetical protein